MAPSGEVKLSDFSSCVQVSESQIQLTIIESERWENAPEVIESLSYGSEADIWSLGIVVKLMIDKVIAFSDVPLQRGALRLNSPVSTPLNEFLNCMIICDPVGLVYSFLNQAGGPELIKTLLSRMNSNQEVQV